MSCLRQSANAPIFQSISHRWVNQWTNHQVDPSPNECIQALVELHPDGSCSSDMQCFEFMANVNGSTVTVSQACQLKLTNLTLQNGMLSGNWSYASGGDSEAVTGNGTFNVPSNPSGGCDLLPCS